MNYFNSKIVQGAVFLLAVLLTACGGGATDDDKNKPGNPAPTVSSTSPANLATGVAPNAAITATFSAPVNVSSVSSTTFTLNNGATGNVSCDGTTATFTPGGGGLTSGTTYTATITTGVKSVAGTAMASNYQWTFTTGAAADITPPTVSSTSPASGATDVATNATITAAFSENMTASTVTESGNFTLKNSTTNANILGTVAYSGTTATFTPLSRLTNSTAYTATISTNVRDAANNAMTNDRTWSFTTGAAADTTRPTVSSTSPATGATNVLVNAAITATFSEDMNASTVTKPGNFTLSAGSTTVPGTVTYNNRTATFAPTSGTLANGTLYTATITTSVQDLATNAMASDRTWSFTTVNGVTAPAITTQPQGTTVAPGQTATFSVVATGSAPLSYQWRKGGVAIAGATSSSYTTPATTLDDTGAQFTVVVSNSAGNVTSNAAVLTVQAATPAPGTVKIVFLHHSTGDAIYWGGTGANVGQRLATYNSTNKTNYLIDHPSYPDSPYPWENYPYDYWNLWVNNTGTSMDRNQKNLDMLTKGLDSNMQPKGYDVIVFKHCYPASSIEDDTGVASVSSPIKSLQNYKLQYAALKARMLQFPDTKFIVWTGAARRADDITSAQALRAVQFFDWVKNTWDQPGDNIFVWDFFNLETGGNANGYLLDANSLAPGNSHPGAVFGARMTPCFVQRMIDVIEGRGDSGSITGGCAIIPNP